jgi:hypothetical protein
VAPELTSTTADTGGDDQALADSLVLTVEDLGPGWLATPSASDQEDSPLDECVADAGALDVEPLAEADSPDFSQGPTQVSSSASVFESARIVADQLAVFTSPEVPGCVTRLLEEELATTLPAGVTLEDFGFELVDYEPVAGTGFAYVGTGTIVAESQQQTFEIVIVGDSADRAGVTATFQFLGEADQALVDRVWAAMEERLDAIG